MLPKSIGAFVTIVESPESTMPSRFTFVLWLGDSCQIAQSPDNCVRTALMATLAVDTAVADVFVSSQDGTLG